MDSGLPIFLSMGPLGYMESMGHGILGEGKNKGHKRIRGIRA